MKVAINGFGRIGRCFLRAIYELGTFDIEIIVINTPGTVESCAHLLKYDSVHGILKSQVSSKEDVLYIDSKKVVVTHERDIKKLDWKKLGIDVVVECSGAFNSFAKASFHITAGAKKVLISAPVSDSESTVIYGVNNQSLKPEHKIISAGSCTTNCLAPLLHVLHTKIGVEKAFMTTVHSYTNDQNVVDNNHKKDMQRARACGLSMIPTTTGAAKTISKVIPELKGKVDGVSIRVPTANVSFVDLTLNTTKNTTVEEVNNIFLDAEKSYLNGVLATCSEPLVSIDFNHSPMSATLDLSSTHVVDGDLVRVGAWYDNEWGFCARMIDILKIL